VHALVSADDHVRNEKHLDEIEAQWGPAPGRIFTNGQSIFVLGRQFGNVLVAVQPGFGYEGDPMRLLFEKGFAPTHAFRRLLHLSQAHISAPMRCCISAPTARSSSCPASNRACRASAGPTG
jgi:hypothetical protein